MHAFQLDRIEGVDLAFFHSTVPGANRAVTKLTTQILKSAKYYDRPSENPH